MNTTTNKTYEPLGDESKAKMLYAIEVNRQADRLLKATDQIQDTISGLLTSVQVYCDEMERLSQSSMTTNRKRSK